jgi:hypothetical protein
VVSHIGLCLPAVAVASVSRKAGEPVTGRVAKPRRRGRRQQPMRRADSHEASTLGHYVRLVGRHKWLVLLAMTATGIWALGTSFRQAPLYEASADVFLARQNLLTTLSRTQDPAAFEAAERVAQTQADLARVPEVAQQACQACHRGNSWMPRQ